jgi:hypothetical protein
MKLINDADLSSPICFLPHHYVLKLDSSTTKLRVVFDASCATSSGVSLNDILMVGPVVQQDLFDIIVRFRLKYYAITADVEKMYRQIWVDPSDQQLQLIIWRDELGNLQSYKLKTVTYGTASAPYLATKVVQQLARDESSNYPKAYHASDDIYVDDLLSGGNNLEELLETRNQLINMFNSAGMKLRKWSSNHILLLDNLPPEDCEIQLEESSCNQVIKALGLSWN